MQDVRGCVNKEIVRACPDGKTSRMANTVNSHILEKKTVYSIPRDIISSLQQLNRIKPFNCVQIELLGLYRHT